MTDLSRSQLEKAWEGVQMINDDDPHTVDHIVDAIEAVLSAPTVQWCKAHDDRECEDHGSSPHCRRGSGTACDMFTLALVPMEDGE